MSTENIAPVSDNIEASKQTKTKEDLVLEEDEDLWVFREETQEEIEADETAGEQCEEVPAPLGNESEEAIKEATKMDLKDTDSAIENVGKGATHLTLVQDRYEGLIKSDPEIPKVYGEISAEITKLNAKLNESISKVVENSGLSNKIDSAACDFARACMEKFIRHVMERAGVFTEYRTEGEKDHSNIEMSIKDVCSSLELLNRPLYWNSKSHSFIPKNVTLGGDEEEEEDEEDADFQPNDEEMDEDDEDWGEEAIENDDEEEEEDDDEEEQILSDEIWLELLSFLNPYEFGVEAEGVEALREASEDYLCNLLNASGKTAAYTGRDYISTDDIRFTQTL